MRKILLIAPFATSAALASGLPVAPQTPGSPDNITDSAAASAPAPDFTKSMPLFAQASGWKLLANGDTEFDRALWREDRSTGSRLYVRKATPVEKDLVEEKRVILKGDDGVHLVSGYRLARAETSDRAPAATKADAKATPAPTAATVETAQTAQFKDGRLIAGTQCENQGSGRECWTVTPDLCAGLVKKGEWTESQKKELRVAEIRALAAVLTLRGEDHQIENVALYGNRFGVKNPKQTTLGRITQGLDEGAKDRLAGLCRKLF